MADISNQVGIMVHSPSERYNWLTDNASMLLCKRYLRKDPEAIPAHKSKEIGVTYNGQPEICDGRHESISDMIKRISFDNAYWYTLFEENLFWPNSPTIFNLGTGSGTLSACFKFDVADTMVGINDVHNKAAMVQKWGGGVGYYLGDIRPKGSPIGSTHGSACGPVAVMRHYHSLASMVTQGGKRHGAQMGILPISHQDIREFIHCKDEDPQGLSTFNISVSVTDDFMRLLSKGAPGLVKLWNELIDSAWRTGDPGVYFYDAAERKNPTPHLGRLTGTNPCGEVPLLSDEACNLGSINLATHLTSDLRQFDFNKLESTTRVAIQYLDKVLDHNWFPDSDITEAVEKTRKLGLGVMGWADALAILGVSYDSEKAVELGRTVMRQINTWAADESRQLGDSKGYYPGSLVGKEEYRNATRTCIAPTGSISFLAGVSSGIEPHFARKWTRTLGDGTVVEEEPVLQELFAKQKPRIANEIDPKWHIRHQAAFQEHTDLAVSKTVNLPHDATRDDVDKAYRLMHSLGCTGGTIFRDGSRDQQVLNSRDPQVSKDIKPEDAFIALNSKEGQRFFQGRESLPKTRSSVTHKFNVGDYKGFVTVGLYENGLPGEVFIKGEKQGSTITGLLDGIAIALSLGLQNGSPLSHYVEMFKGQRFEPAGMTGNPEIPVASSILDYLGKWFELKFLDTVYQPQAGMFCPNCQSEAVYSENCLKCVSPTCGWSKC